MKYLQSIIRIILIISVLVIIVLAIVEMPKKSCESIQAIPHTQNESVILAQHEVEALLKKAGIQTIGKKIKEIDLPAITELLQKNPYVKEINFVHFAGSKLVIDYTLRNIILHVYTNDGDQYFVDDEGALMPYTNKIQDFLFIANGNIHQHYKSGDTAKKELASIVELANLLNSDAFYKAQFRQIYRNEKNQIELVSTIGNQIILFGNMDNAEEKLDNLKQVYQNGISHKGYDQYAQLDVRYKNRVVAQHR